MFIVESRPIIGSASAAEVGDSEGYVIISR
jgi:hypothetical protein